MKKIFLLASVLFSLCGFSQTVNNTLTFKKGQKLEMVSKVNSVISMEMMGQAMETKIDATITKHFDIENADNAMATIEHKMKRIQMSIESPITGANSLDSDNEKDMKGDGGKEMEKALKNKYTMTVDAKGKITNVKADDNNPNKTEAKASEGMMANAMSQVAGGMTLPKAGDLSDFSILPDQNLAKGATWADSTKASKTVYTVSDITDAEIIVDYIENGTSERVQEGNGMEIKISAKEKTTGKIMLDRKTGLLKEKTGVTESEGTMEMMGQTLPMTTKTQKTITVKEAK